MRKIFDQIIYNFTILNYLLNLQSNTVILNYS
jgi:hypothetical protein